MTAFVLVCSALLFSADADDAKALLEEKGLSLSSSTWVLESEKELSEKLDAVKPVQRKLKDAEKQFERGQQFESNRKEGMRQMKGRYDQLAQMLDRVPQGDYDQHNRIVREMNQLQSKLTGANLDGDELDAVKEARGDYEKTRAQFIDAIHEAQAIAAKVEAQYEALGEDDDVKEAIEAYDKTVSRPISLGPSRSFKSDQRELTKLSSKIHSESIKLRPRGGVNIVDVILNGDVHEEFILDTGASLICLPARIAKEAGVEPTDSDQDIRMKIANGETIPGKLVVLQSVRVGEFVVENVECAVMDARYPDVEPLLGNSFLGNFNHQIDPNGPALILSKVGEEEKPSTSSRRKRTSRTKGD